MKQKICVFVLVFVLGITAAASADYTYNFDSAIPKEVQEEAFRNIRDIVEGMTESDKSYSYAELLDLYIRFYGIYSPESVNNNNTVIWMQENLLNDSDRTTYIPDRYTSQEDLAGWVKRYAEPGDLLLYKINGKPDKCIVYAGDGQVIGRTQQGNKIVDMRATYSNDESYRTKSGGLFAIAHMWKEIQEVEEEEEYLDLHVQTQEKQTAFTQNQFIVWERNNETGKYEKSTAYVLMEYSPGEYRFWNGSHFGFSDQYIQDNNGIHIQLISTESDKSQINKTIGIEIEKNEAQALSNTDKTEYTIEIETESENSFQWNGTDLLKVLGGYVE